MNVGIYARVSTQEQAQHGLSIDAQIEALRAWAKENNHIIVGEYVDPGISGKTPPNKRPAMSRFFEDLEQGLKVDIFAFTKLDRFFRSVKLYYKAIEVMERHSVAWDAIQEDYETLTASGRFKVNIMLSVAEDEADRTSERVKAVFEAKRERGDYIGAAPFGYIKRDSKLLIDEKTFPAMQKAFDHFINTRSLGEVQRMLRDNYDVTMSRQGIKIMLCNTHYADLDVISKETIQQVHEILISRSQRNTAKSTYIFSGLLYCSECGQRMMAGSDGKGQKKTYYCATHRTYQRCTKNSIRQNRVEDLLLSRLPDAIHEENLAIVTEEAPDTEAIRKRLEKLKDLYLDDLISKDLYSEEYKALTTKLDDALSSRRIIPEQELHSALGLYHEMTDEQKRAFWSRLVRRVYIRPGTRLEDRIERLLVL